MRSFKSEHIPKPRSPQIAPVGGFDIEIGCGVGLHPVLYAKANPDRTLVALERTQEKFEKFERRFHGNGAPGNLIAIHDDAINWITHRVAPNTLERVFILYPNPEPHNKNQRFAFMPFMSFLVSRMIPDGELILATNIKSYSDECLEHFPSFGLLNISVSTPELPGRTHFERKYLARKEDCYNLVFKRSV